MRGHVRRRGKQSWCFVADIGTDEHGKRKQRWVGGFEREKDAQSALRRFLQQLEDGYDPTRGDEKVKTFVERWLKHLETLEKPRPRTRKRYRELLEGYVVPVVGGMKLAKVNVPACQRVLDAAQDSGLAPRTVQQVRSAASSAWRYAVRQEIVRSNPWRATETATAKRPELTIPTPDDMRALEEEATGTMWEVPVMLACATGARRGEILGVRWSDFDAERGRIRIERTVQRIDKRLTFAEPKTEQATRDVPVPRRIAERLLAHKREQNERRLLIGPDWVDEDLICDNGEGGPIDPDSFTKAFKRLADAIGKPTMRLHDVRHGVATLLAKNPNAHPMAVAALLGHSKVSFTMSTYGRPDDGMLDTAASAVEDALG